jgi:hypothetical protein
MKDLNEQRVIFPLSRKLSGLLRGKRVKVIKKLYLTLRLVAAKPRRVFKAGYLMAFLIAIPLCASCASGTRLNTGGVQEFDTKSTYRVIFFGCNYLNDLETLAFLDKEDDKYVFDPYAPDFRYRMENGVAVNDALEKVDKFLNCNASFSHSRISMITASDGHIVGYEVRPLYLPMTYGIDDVLETDYWLKDDKVVIRIRLLPYIEKRLHGDGRDRDL